MLVLRTVKALRFCLTFKLTISLTLFMNSGRRHKTTELEIKGLYVHGNRNSQSIGIFLCWSLIPIVYKIYIFYISCLLFALEGDIYLPGLKQTFLLL